VIRNATLVDIPHLVALGELFHSQTVLSELLPYDAPSVEQMLMHAIGDGACTVVVLTKQDEVVGAICGAVVPLYWNVNVLVGQQFAWFVQPSKRCGLISLKLLDAFETWAFAQGASAVFSGAKNDEGAQGMEKLLSRRGYLNLESMYLKVRSK
jgi:hypothetical protein